MLGLLQERHDWLVDQKHSDQWSDVGEWRCLVRHLCRHGNTWVLIDPGLAITGTLTLLREPDFDFWRTEERSESALYLSKLATSRRVAGQELGAAMMEWVVRQAAAHAIPRLRLDAAKRSAGLHRYYSTRGWQYIRTVDLPDRPSGMLFERMTGARPEPARFPLTTDTHVP